MLQKIKIFTVLFGLVFSIRAYGAEDPDELYALGRYSEAEKAYAQSDMDHPKDVRYRYNRGCSAYQDSDYQGASAAFSSVLRRAEDDDTRFKSAYNLGNTAFNLGEFATAADHYRQAILHNPESEDARYNFEVTLRELEKQKNKSDQPDSPTGEKQDSQGQNGDQSQGGERQQDQDKPSEGTPPDQASSKGQDGQNEKGKTEPGKKGTSEQTSPEDLSGDLKTSQALPDEAMDQPTDEAGSTLDKKKAESLLDNIKDDLSRFMRLQVPEEKRQGVQSGKDW
ncbi:MAG: tetratricopeptide repeat protein [Thermodesulfobacteriota bacterium]|nr:tetratricopeptide repeat protein [Thermodesulfobacteriota bacterium]